MKLALLLMLLVVNTFAMEITIVSLDKKTEKKLGFFPWDDKKMTQLLDTLKEHQPSFILSLLPIVSYDSYPETKRIIKNNQNYHFRLDKGGAPDQFGRLIVKNGRYDFKKSSLLRKFSNEAGIYNALKELINGGIDSSIKVNSISILDLYTNPKLKIPPGVFILAYHGRNVVKHKYANGKYYYPSEILSYFMDFAFKRIDK
jgi:hypothetical protein